ncbi:hypothetical protein F5Y14DRAFT_451864 [Nemania sp. NC0429]|nr:hypothetical protein F5Y14DRAFT_451864 [Nemania sp. NC0429]
MSSKQRRQRRKRQQEKRQQEKRQQEKRQQEKRELQQRGFPRFGELPTELRLEIWAHTWSPRAISLTPINRKDFRSSGAKNRLPTSAYVNSESRFETLRHYKRWFAQPDKPGFHWFNYRLDTLYMPTPLPLKDILDFIDIKKVQRLIVPASLPSIVRAATLNCDIRSEPVPEPVPESSELTMVEDQLKEKFPGLREVTMTTINWCEGKRDDDQKSRKGPWGWSCIEIAYVSGLKVLYSSDKTYRRRYRCRLSEEEIEFLGDSIIQQVIWQCYPY